MARMARCGSRSPLPRRRPRRRITQGPANVHCAAGACSYRRHDAAYRTRGAQSNARLACSRGLPMRDSHCRPACVAGRLPRHPSGALPSGERLAPCGVRCSRLLAHGETRVRRGQAAVGLGEQRGGLARGRGAQATSSGDVEARVRCGLDAPALLPSVCSPPNRAGRPALPNTQRPVCCPLALIELKLDGALTLSPTLSPPVVGPAH